MSTDINYYPGAHIVRNVNAFRGWVSGPNRSPTGPLIAITHDRIRYMFNSLAVRPAIALTNRKWSAPVAPAI